MRVLRVNLHPTRRGVVILTRCGRISARSASDEVGHQVASTQRPLLRTGSAGYPAGRLLLRQSDDLKRCQLLLNTLSSGG